jgi:hypothetical protein
MFKIGDRVVAIKDIKGLKNVGTIVALKNFTGVVEKDSKEIFPDKPRRLLVRFCDGGVAACKPSDIRLISG